MNDAICNYVDYTHISDIESITETEVVFKLGKSWIRVIAENNVIYTSDTQNPDDGPLKTEKVSITAKTKDVSGLINNKEYYILRVNYNNSNYIIGSLNYPCQKTFSDDKIQTSFEFTAKSPVK